MNVSNRLPRRIAIGQQPTIPAAAEEAQKISRYLLDHGVEQVLCAPLTDEAFQNNLSAGEFDLLMALGGDGTMLRAGHLCGPVGVPVLGVNLGRFGFLAEVKRGEWPTVLPELVAGRYRLEDRMMLQRRTPPRRGDTGSLGGVQRGGGLPRAVCAPGYPAGQCGRLCAGHLRGRRPDRGHADRLYGLCPGGRRADFTARIAQYFTRAGRAAPFGGPRDYLAEGACVTIRVQSTTMKPWPAWTARHPVNLLDGDEIQVGASQHTARFVRFQDPGYFYRN